VRVSVRPLALRVNARKNAVRDALRRLEEPGELIEVLEHGPDGWLLRLPVRDADWLAAKEAQLGTAQLAERERAEYEEQWRKNRERQADFRERVGAIPHAADQK
jgi:predicted YcjX-like family ATPase